MANTFFLKKGDTWPNIFTQLSDENGNIDLTGASVLFRMSMPDTGNLMIEEPAGIVGQGNPDDWGKCWYEWQTGDTDEVGIYRAEWRVTFPNGKIATFPRGVAEQIELDGIYNKIIIQEEVD